MKWITRQHIHVDRVACPWLIKKFIDADAEFLFVSPDQVFDVAKQQGAIPFDMHGQAELDHHEGRCTFETIIKKYNLTNPALTALAKIVHAADIVDDLNLAPEASGLEAIARGFGLICSDDSDNLAKQLIVYDALYAHCQSRNNY